MWRRPSQSFSIRGSGMSDHAGYLVDPQLVDQQYDPHPEREGRPPRGRIAVLRHRHLKVFWECSANVFGIENKFAPGWEGKLREVADRMAETLKLRQEFLRVRNQVAKLT